MPTKDKAKQRRYVKKHYDANTQYYVDKATRAKAALVAELIALKEASPCVDCGVSYPYYVMQYDHTSNNKVADVSRLAGAGCRRKMLDEIAKCDLVCANCHCTRTWMRRRQAPIAQRIEHQPTELGLWEFESL